MTRVELGRGWNPRPGQASDGGDTVSSLVQVWCKAVSEESRPCEMWEVICSVGYWSFVRLWQIC